jgi:hypothetical protein
MFQKTSDSSFVNTDGRVVYFSCERFVRDICEGDCCFICGASPRSVPFNDEHVLPDWVLRRYGIASRPITLPNGTSFRYDQYKVPCCADCNSEMGCRVEEPISRLICSGADAVREQIQEHGALLIVVWLGLIFLKTHLKDRQLRLSRDLRKPDDPIASLYDWADLHHIHTLVRCFYTGAEIASKVFGSFVMLPVHDTAEERFDYGDFYQAQSAFVRMDNFAFLTVFNDSCGAFTKIAPKLERICGPVSDFQLRELVAEFAFVNLHLKERPVYMSQIDALKEEIRIEVQLPEFCELTDMDPAVRGQLMQYALKDRIKTLSTPGMSQEDLISAIQSGHFTFLFDDEMNFIHQAPVVTGPTDLSQS